MISKLLLITLSLTLISCIEVRDPDAKTKVAEEVQSQPIVEVRPLPQPQRYAVLIKGLPDRSRISRRVIGNLKFGEAAQLANSTTEAEDIIEQAGHYEYSVQQGERNFQLRVVIPQDYVVSGDMKLQQLEKDLKLQGKNLKVLETDGRVYFKAGASLTTMGENLLIKAQSIESEGALLQTFPVNQTSKFGVDGNHGGHIKLEALALRGTLQVIMRGGNGGLPEASSFLSGKKMDQLNNNGHKGGNSGLLEVKIQDQSQGDITFELEPGKGSAGQPIMTFCFSLNANIPCRPRMYKPKGEDGLNGVAQQPLGLK